MRIKYLTIILSLVCAISIQAQTLDVKSFAVKANDITARTQPRQDINGKDCALVKVQLAAPNAVFEGNVIGNVAYNTSEYLVYMAQGSKKLTVKLEGYLPLEVSFQDYDIGPLEPKTVYLLTISGVTNGKEQEPVRTKTGWIILDSEPSGASVYINDEFVGNTPLSNYKQAYGTYQYRLESPNYHPATGIIELNAGRFAQKVVLKPAFGSISVKSSIAGAKIVLDGKQTGKQTPATLKEIPSGSHTISLQMDKYAPRQQEVIVEDGQTANVTLTLDARFARIAINSLDGAEIYSNGKLLGKGRISEDMMEGYYDLEARLNHHKSVTKQIQVVAGQAQDITLNPIPKYGSLDITSTPYDANITIDGKAYGKTPMTVEHLLEGEHHVVLSLEGYTKEARDVRINEKESASLEVVFSKEGPVIKTIDIDNAPTKRGVETFTVNGVSFKMICVESGSFTMGATSEQGSDADSDEKPTHPVTLSTYYIGETEVTQELWQAVMGSNPSHFSGAKRPVECVSWNDCQDFITKLNAKTGRKFRLPTEAEWEFAARGGTKSRGYKYAGSNTIGNVAWYWDNIPSQSSGNTGYGTQNVATKQANELGLYDMSGNVWEWCQDWYGSYSNSSQTNPTGPNSGHYRVYRGGSWYYLARRCRVSSRPDFTPSNRNDYLGLRLALPKPPKQSEVIASTEGKTPEVVLDKYEAKDPRIKNDDYRIVGTDFVETVREGDNLKRIARRTLGEGMECYIEVYNDLKATSELKKGQEIKIPKLERMRKNQ